MERSRARRTETRLVRGIRGISETPSKTRDGVKTHGSCNPEYAGILGRFPGGVTDIQ